MIWLAIKGLFFTLLVIKVILYFTNARCKSNVCLVGKTALITGGNSGLGLELAKQLASRGCIIIIADKDDATNTVKKLIKETKNPHISARIVDFESFKSVRLFAKELNQDVEKLHILVNNAGTADMSYKKTEDEIRKIMQVNYFSHFLLTHLLLELLLKSAPSRIIYTSSLAAYIAYLSGKDLKGKLPSNWFIRTAGSYCGSKLAGAIMSRILASKLKNSGVTSNTYHPGVVRTNLWYSGSLPNLIMSFVWLLWPCIFGKSTEEGIQTLLYLSCAEEVESETGEFFMECTSVWQPLQVYNTEFCNKIWEISEECVDLKPEEKVDTILQQYRKRT